jgi:hypothetical protein
MLLRRDRKVAGACGAFALALATSVLAFGANAQSKDTVGEMAGAGLARAATGAPGWTGLLASGQIATALSDENLRIYNDVKRNKKAFSNFRNYRAWPQCTYSLLRKSRDGNLFTDVISMSSALARDRLLVRLSHSKGTSTALIGADGTAFDFNWVHFESGDRITSENVESKAADLLEREKSGSAPPGSVVVVDFMTVSFPRFQANSFKHGQVAAVITRTDGSKYAEFVYGGMTTYKETPAIVLEIIANRDGSGGTPPVLVGYSLLRQSDMMPLRRVWQTDRMEVIDLIRCS